jgi:hypothetical protein
MSLHVAAFLAALIMTYLCCHPVLMFVRRGWFIKKQEVVNSLSERAKKKYIEAFLKRKTSYPIQEFEESTRRGTVVIGSLYPQSCWLSFCFF